MSRWPDELRRRKVGRVVLAYAAAAFVVLQVADIVLPPLGAPDWVMAALVVVTALGFPVAFALAWSFDLTVAGVIRTADVASDVAQHPSSPAVPRRGFDRRALLVVAVLAILSISVSAWYVRGRYIPDPALDQELVAVLPFRVSGDPSLEYLREGMVDLFTAALSGEGGPRAADPRVVLVAVDRIAGHKDAELSADSAKLVAHAVGAGRVLIGSVVGTPGEVLINASLVRVSGTARTIDASERGPAEQLTTLIDRVTATLLTLDAGETDQRLATLTSTSLPALRAYLAGQKAYRRSRFGEAARHFDEAVVHDSTFALAALLLHTMAGWGDEPTPNAPRARDLAWQYRDRLGPLDRVFLEARLGAQYPQPRPVAVQLADWEHALAQLGERADALFHYGDIMVHWGAIADRADFVDASTRIFERSLQVDSSFMPSLTHLLDIAMYQRDTARARSLFALLERRDTSRASARYQYLARSLFMSDSASRRGLIANLDTLASGDLYFLRVGIGYFVPTHVARSAAEITLQRAITPAQRDEALFSSYVTALNGGRPAEAAAHARAALRHGSANELAWHARVVSDALFWDADTAMAVASAGRIQTLLDQAGANHAARTGAACAAGLWHGMRGELQRAADAAAAAESGAGAAHSVTALCGPTIRAVMAYQAGAGDAAALLAYADSLAGAGPTGDAALRRALNFALARVHELNGSLELARRAVRRRSWDLFMYTHFSTFLREEGRLSERLGDRAAAIDAYRRYLELRPDVEPSLAPQVAEVHAALTRLTGDAR